MKRTLIYALSAIALLALNCSCTKQETEPSGVAATVEEQIITAYVNIATKVVYSENSSGMNAGLKSVWERGDYFYAIQDGSKVVQFTMSSDNYAGKTYAVFTAKTSGVTSSTTWKAVLGQAASVSGTTIKCDYLGQAGTLNSLGRYNYVVAEASGTEPSFDFDNGTKLSHILRIKLPEGVKCIEYTPCGYENVTAGSNETNFLNSSEENNYGDSRTTTITLSSASSLGDAVYIAIPCLDYSRTYQTYNSNKQTGNLRTGVILTLLNNDSDNADYSNGTVFEGDVTEKHGQIETLDMTAMTLIRRPKLSETINYKKTSEQSLAWSSNKQKASSVNTYWAPFNLGATQSSEVGYYVSFGEIDVTKTTFSWVSFHNRHKPDGSTFRNDVTSNKRVGGSNTSFYSISGSRYDVARVKWGVDWRMPYSIETYTLWNGGSTAQITGGVRHTCTETNASIDIPCSGLKAHNDDGTQRNFTAANQLTKDTTTYEPTNNNMPRFWMADKNNRSHDGAGWNEAYTYGPATDYSTGDYWRRYELCGLPIRAVHASSSVTWVN